MNAHASWRDAHAWLMGYSDGLRGIEPRGRQRWPENLSAYDAGYTRGYDRRGPE